ASIVCQDESSAIQQTRKVITMLPNNNLAPTPFFEFAQSATPIEADGCPKDIVKSIADEDSVIEINTDYANGIFTFMATLAGVSTGFIATSKKNPIDVKSCDKATRFVKTCDAFNIPIITLVNTIGFEMTSDLSLIKRSAELSSAYAEATTAKVSVITGKAYGSAYIALGSKNANADITIAWPQAEISALSPDSAVEFLMSDKLAGVADQKTARADLVEEYLNTVASPFEAAKGGFIDKVILPEKTRETLINMFDILASKRETKLPKKHSTI
ncbi:MAG: carboxyl transferase domain-containing protein, partial [Oscillospiraceae bacterium]